MKSVFGMIAGIFLSAGPVLAGVDLAQAQACFDTAASDQTNPSQCIDAAQNACMDNAQETPAVAALCFSDARAVWSQAIGAEMSDMSESAEEGLVAVARIETKYDLLANLLQCDRMEELSLAVSTLSSDAIALQSARCQSTAAALTYMRLYLSAQSLPNGDPK